MENKLQRVINLAKKAGDKVIVYDSHEPENSYVIMSIDDYEKSMRNKSEVKNLTENELLDKINRDIANWKNEQIIEGSSNISRSVSSEEVPDIKEEIENTVSEEIKNAKKNKGWSIPSERKAAAEEVIDEDRQYLEEITY